MKINIVRDKSGKVVATFEQNSHGASSTMVPVLHPGETIEEMEVHANYKENLAHLYALTHK